MRFYLVESSVTGETLGCQLNKASAFKLGDMLEGKGNFRVDAIDVKVSIDSVRRLLGNVGGYATNQHEVTR